MTRRRTFPALTTVGLVVLFSQFARAELMTYAISGTVGGITDESTDHYVPTAITDGSTFTGTISFDNSAPGTSDANGAYYRGTALDLSVNILIDGQYDYQDTTPSSSDEIDIEGTSFGLYKRGPVVSTGFAPDPPFSHLDFAGTTQTEILSNAQLSTGISAGVSDAEAYLADPSAYPYYYIGANISTVQQVVPEPSTLGLLAACAAALLIHFASLARNSKLLQRLACRSNEPLAQFM